MGIYLSYKERYKETAQIQKIETVIEKEVNVLKWWQKLFITLGILFLRVPWTARRSNQYVLKEISPEYWLEGLMLKLKLQSFGHLMWRADSSEKTLMLGKTEGGKRRGWQRMRLVGWHHRLNGHEFKQTPGDGEGQGSLAFCSPWGRKESDTTEQLNNNFSYAVNTSMNITEVKGQCCPAWQ